MLLMLLRFMKGLELFIPFFCSGGPPLPMFEARPRRLGQWLCPQSRATCASARALLCIWYTYIQRSPIYRCTLYTGERAPIYIALSYIQVYLIHGRARALAHVARDFGRSQSALGASAHVRLLGPISPHCRKERRSRYTRLTRVWYAIIESQRRISPIGQPQELQGLDGSTYSATVAMLSLDVEFAVTKRVRMDNGIFASKIQKRRNIDTCKIT